MSDSSSEHEELKALWQDQTPETDPMTLERIQVIGGRLDRLQQRTMTIAIVVGAFVIFMIGRGWQKTDDPLTHAALALWGLGIAGYLMVVYRLTHLTRDPTEPAGLFLRRRLARGLRPHRLLLLAAPILPGMLALFAVAVRNVLRNPHLRHLSAGQWALNLLPLVVLAAVWVFTMCVSVPRARRRIRDRIAELDAMLEK